MRQVFEWWVSFCDVLFHFYAPDTEWRRAYSFTLCHMLHVCTSICSSVTLFSTVCVATTPTVFKVMVESGWKLHHSKDIDSVHRGHRTLIKILLIELHTLDFLRKFVLYTWHSRVNVFAASTVFKIIIWNLQQSKNIGWACALRPQNSDKIFC